MGSNLSDSEMTAHSTAVSPIGQEADVGKTVAELAEANFHAAERLRYMGMMNMPTDPEARLASAIAYAEAQAAAVKAKRELDAAINGDPPTTSTAGR